MEHDSILDEEDVRSMVGLLGTVASSAGPLESKRVQMLEGLCGLIDADLWVWSFMGEIDLEKPPVHTVFLNGGFRDGEFIKFLKIQEHPDLQWMTEPFMAALAEKEGHVTRLQTQLVSEEKVNQADIFPHLLDADLGPILLSGRPTTSGQLSVISFFRRTDRELFSSRDARIAHIMLSEVPWLHDNSWPQHPRSGISGLTPRQRTILGLLLQGMGRKQLASEVGLSIHTVNDYVKEIYEAFEVHSQAELIRRFIEGDGGDHAPHCD